MSNSTSISSKEANGAIDELVTSINNDLQDNELVKENIKNSIVDTTRIENIKTNENGKVVSKEKKVIDNFYFLDREDKIRVLRQIWSTLKGEKVSQKNDSLVLLEEEDIKNEKLYIPVQKTIGLKRK